MSNIKVVTTRYLPFSKRMVLRGTHVKTIISLDNLAYEEEVVTRWLKNEGYEVLYILPTIYKHYTFNTYIVGES